MTFTRREFLGMIPAAAVALSPSCRGCVSSDTSAAAPPPKGAPESWAVSVCGGCPGGCGIRARIVGGRLVRVAGNPLHPVNRGGLCALGLSAPHLFYHPDRVRGPLRRSGPRDTGELRPVGWDEAIAEVAGRLKNLRGRGAAHTVAIIDGTRGLAAQAAERFLRAYGSPNHLAGRPWRDAAPTAAMRSLQGVETPAVYDLENTRLVLAFGSGWLDGSPTPVGAARAYGIARRGRRSGRARVVHVEARLSRSAALADEWVPIVPGTEGVLALGLMHMILREGLEDRDFLERWSAGFPSVRAIVLHDYQVNTVSERTGVPVPVIIRIARQFASARPAVAIGDDWDGPGSQSMESRMAIHALNALVGSINAPGGVLTPASIPLDAPPDPPADERGARGRAQAPIAGVGPGSGSLAMLKAWLDGAGGYAVNAILAYGSDPLAILGGGEGARATFERVPFIVSFSPFLDETTRIADVVLPDHTYLERWQDDPCSTSRGFPVMGLRQPVLAPRHDTRHAAETLAAIARGVGGPVGMAFPQHDFRDVLRDAVRGIHRSGRGALFDVPEAEAWVGMMERSGWRASRFGDFDEFWANLQARGGWWDPIYEHSGMSRALRTAAGKFDFAPLLHAAEVDASPDGRQISRMAGGPATAPSGFPLKLHLYPLLDAFGDAGGPLPWVQDVLGGEMGQSWNLWVEIAPNDARTLGIGDGDRVRVESPEGSVEARAAIYDGLRPGTVAMPLGPGGARGRRLKRALVDAAASLVKLARAGAGDEPSWGETWVRIRGA